MEAALAREDVDEAIDRSLQAAQASGITGKAVTPFLLARLAEETGGRTLAANRALVVSNAAVAARISAALSAARSVT
jgi:pseudouridine-5'-phosphate glycosidase